MLLRKLFTDTGRRWIRQWCIVASLPSSGLRFWDLKMPCGIVIQITGQRNPWMQSANVSGGGLAGAIVRELHLNPRTVGVVKHSSSERCEWTAESCVRPGVVILRGRSRSWSRVGPDLEALDGGWELFCPRRPFSNATRGLRRKTSVLAGTGGVLDTSVERAAAGWDKLQTIERSPEMPAWEGGALDWRHMVGEREEAKAVLSQFLSARGLSATAAARIANKAYLFIAHLLSLLHSRHKKQYLAGDELSTDQIRNTIRPYLRTLASKYGKGLAEAVVSFPHVPLYRQGAEGSVISMVTIDELGQEKVTELNLMEYPTLLRLCVGGKLPVAVTYFFSIGMSPQQVEAVLLRAPSVAGYKVDTKIKRVVDYVIEMGVPPASIPRIIMKRPQLFGCSVEENLRPTASFLEELGVNKDRWARIMVKFPHILTYSLTKLQETVDFLLEIGFSAANAGKIISIFPHVVSYSVEAKLRPICTYFKSIGIVDVSLFILRSPQILGLSQEGNIKTTIGLLVGLGFTMDEVTKMVNRFPQILGLNVDKNLLPKWEFFVFMERSKSQLVDFPQYFGYSLRKRIQPRHRICVKMGVSTSLNYMLSATDTSFQIYLHNQCGVNVAEISG